MKLTGENMYVSVRYMTRSHPEQHTVLSVQDQYLVDNNIARERFHRINIADL